MSTAKRIENYKVIGPIERQPCDRHPDHEISYRWFWEASEGPESGDVEVVKGCPHPEHEDD